jgi:hypothetical protein
VLAGRRGLAGLLEHPRDHPLVLIQQSKAATSKQCKKLRCSSSMTRKRCMQCNASIVSGAVLCFVAST